MALVRRFQCADTGERVLGISGAAAEVVRCNFRLVSSKDYGGILGNMLNSDYAGQNCSIARSLEAVGERWTLLIVRELLRRPHRFAELERKLGIAKNVLTIRLGKLVERGIVEKVAYAETRDWNDYRLTRKGKDLFAVISALMAWGDRYEAPDGPPVIFEHDCGHAAGHKLVCAYCGDDIVPRALTVIAGPGATEETILS
jgi:DNA-binding HxlR family transcriptional regulator